jgi:glycosyltransferase involved in cell wall biosynthesis
MKANILKYTSHHKIKLSSVFSHHSENNFLLIKMTEQNELILILDALDQVISDPLGRHSWRQFGIQAIKNTDPNILRLMRERITNEIDQHGLGGFYRAVFLRHILGIKNEMVNAGKVLEDLRPIHIDRIMSYINFEWGNIVADARSSTEFIQLMEIANIPRLMALVNTCILTRTPPRSSPPSKRIKRIAIYTPQLFNRKHPPTKLAFEHARLLQLQGFEVRIFSCQEQSIVDMREYLSNDGHLKIPPPETKFDNQITFQSPVEIVRAQVQFSLPLRAQCILQLMNIFDPDLCFFVGHQSLLLKSLYQRYPLLALNISSTEPSGDLDVWLSADVSAIDARQNTANQAYYHPFRTIQKEKLASLNREDLGLRSDAVVLITAGTRLPKEIVGDWALAMLEICTRFPQVVWLLVGGDGTMSEVLQAANAANIKSLPYQSNLKGIYNCCDIYLNPPRLGGGFSVAEAMAEGLPTLAFSDTDGGKKLGALAAKNNEDYFAELIQLITDPAFRDIKGKQMQEIFHSTINLENSTPSLLRAIALTQEKFEQRCTQI